MLTEAYLRGKIDRQYRELDLQLGWDLLYTSLSTLTEKSGVAFIGLNPGGGPRAGSPREPNVGQKGKYCSYLDSSWGGYPPGENPLQLQIQAVFRRVAEAWGHQDHIELLRTSVAGNLIPFRSPRWSQMKAHENACMDFGQSLWREILDSARPRLVVTLTKKVSNAILRAYELDSTYDARSTQWGTIKWRVAKDLRGVPFRTLISLPHLATFRLFDRRPRSKEFEKAFVDECRSAKRKSLM